MARGEGARHSRRVVPPRVAAYVSRASSDAAAGGAGRRVGVAAGAASGRTRGAAAPIGERPRGPGDADCRVRGASPPRRAHRDRGTGRGRRGTDAAENPFRTSPKSELVALVPDPVQRPDTLAASKPLDAAVLERGVTMRTVYLNSIRNDPASIAYSDWLSGIGGQIRTAPTVPLRLIIFDRTTAMVPIDPARQLRRRHRPDRSRRGGGDVRAVRADLGYRQPPRRAQSPGRARPRPRGARDPAHAGERRDRRAHRAPPRGIHPHGRPQGLRAHAAPRDPQPLPDGGARAASSGGSTRREGRAARRTPIN